MAAELVKLESCLELQWRRYGKKINIFFIIQSVHNNNYHFEIPKIGITLFLFSLTKIVFDENIAETLNKRISISTFLLPS